MTPERIGPTREHPPRRRREASPHRHAPTSPGLPRGGRRRPAKVAPPGRPVRVLLAGGGTGGHVFPGVALAQEIVGRRPGSQVVLAGTGRPVEARALEGTGFGHADVGAAPFPRRLGALWRFACAETRALARARRLVRSFRPDVTIGLGGYAAAPVGLVSWAAGVPVFLLEQNARPGLANRLLARVATAVFAAFGETVEALPRAAVEVLGNPVRRSVMERVPGARAELGLDPDPSVRTLLIVGGSQGARAINAACERHVAALGAVRAGVQVIHLTGAEDETRMREAYARADVRAHVAAVRADMATCYAASDLVLARAGGTTIAELAARGVPSVLVPLPHAAEDHQRLNAEALARVGGALVRPEGQLAGEGLGAVLAILLDPQRLTTMAAAARAWGRRDAARAIAARILEHVGRKCGE